MSPTIPIASKVFRFSSNRMLRPRTIAIRSKAFHHQPRACRGILRRAVLPRIHSVRPSLPDLAPSAATTAYPASVPAPWPPFPSKPHQVTLFSNTPRSTSPTLHPRPNQIRTFFSSSQSSNLSTKHPTTCGTPARMLPLRLCRSMHMQGVEADPASLSTRMTGVAPHNHGSNVSARPPLQQMQQQHPVHTPAPRLAGHLRRRRPANRIATPVAVAGLLRIEPAATAIV